MRDQQHWQATGGSCRLPLPILSSLTPLSTAGSSLLPSLLIPERAAAATASCARRSRLFLLPLLPSPPPSPPFSSPSRLLSSPISFPILFVLIFSRVSPPSLVSLSFPLQYSLPFFSLFACSTTAPASEKKLEGRDSGEPCSLSFLIFAQQSQPINGVESKHFS